MPAEAGAKGKEERDNDATGSEALRYLLYDTRFGMSFAAQTEVLFVAMEVVSELNQQLPEHCDARDISCRPWALVLPPWCSVVHWYGEDAGRGLPWRELLRVRPASSRVQVLEFEDYARRAGGAEVELLALPAAVPGASRSPAKGGQGSFAGWESGFKSCQAGGQVAPQQGSQGGVAFSGYCDGDIRPAETRCGVLLQPSAQALLDMLRSAPARSKASVLLKHLDVLGLHAPEGGASAAHGQALRPAKALREIGDTFIKKTLGEMEYLGVHLRRNEFAQHHPSTTPTAAAAAARINAILKEQGLEQVFVATDGRPEFKEALRAKVKAPLYYFAPDDGAVVPEHKGREEVTVLQVLAKARHFIGSAFSAYSAAVRRERRRSKAPVASSEEVFCEHLEVVGPGKRCTAAAGGA